MREIRPFIILSLAALIAASAWANEPVPEPAGARFPNIRASLDDGFFALAEQQARGVLRAQPGPKAEDEATLLLLHALWGQKRFSEMLDVLETRDVEPGFVYWRARALYELKRYAQAARVLGAPDETLRASRYAPAATRLKGRIERVSGDLTAAKETYRGFSEAYPEHRDLVANRFDLAETLTDLNQIPDAMAEYQTLSEHPDRRVADRARLRHARLLYTHGAKENYAAAREQLTALATNAQTRLAYRIDAYVDLAELEDKASNVDAAEKAMRAGVALSPDARQRVPLKLELARLLSREGDTSAALKLLEECRAEAPNETIATELQLEKAKALSLAEKYAEAVEAFQVYLDVANDSEGLADAYFGKGLALWALDRHAEAAPTLDKAAAALKDPSRAADALFKAADAYYAAEKMSEAEKRYRAFIAEYPKHESLPNALYQLGLTLAREGGVQEALAVFDRVEVEHAGSPFAELAALRAADVLWAGQRWEDVLSKYENIAGTYTNRPETVALSEHQRGLALYTLGRYAEAQAAFETVAQKYPDTERGSQALYLRGFSLYRQGLVEQGVRACRDFVEKFPESPWTPEVIFWLAEQYFNQGDYAAAEPLFLRFVDEFKTHRLAPRAVYWAGRCAAARSNYTAAIERYSSVAKNHPESEIMPRTRFAQGDALTQLGEFARAILAFEEIIKNFPESDLYDAAWGRKGDCQFTLGRENPARYAEALNSYQAILDRPSAPATLRLHVETKIGECLEKMNQPDKAFSRYMNVVYTFLNDKEKVGRSPYTVTWFTRAAIAAGSIKERERAWEEAVKVYERLVEANVPSKDWALERVEKIRTDNWLLFQRSEETNHVGIDG